MLPDSLRTLTRLFARLPGVGEKTAQRFALHFLDNQFALAHALGAALLDLPARVGLCTRCGNIAERSVDNAAEPEELLCRICQDPNRDRSLLCVVAKVVDLIALERSGAMPGTYFVLGKLLSPLDGVGPEELPLAELRARVAEGVGEIIVATPPSVDGEATALLLAQELQSDSTTVTRIASGIPHGGDLEFTDQITLSRAIRGRRGVGGPG